MILVGSFKLLSEFQAIGLFYWQFGHQPAQYAGKQCLHLALQHLYFCPCLNLGPLPLGSRFQLHNSQRISIPRRFRAY